MQTHEGEGMKNCDYYLCSCCFGLIEQDEIYYQFGDAAVCEKCLPEYLIRFAETADYSER
jgi:hypothetical protein